MTAIVRFDGFDVDLQSRRVSRRGYRFIAPVYEAVPTDGALARRPRLIELPFLHTSGEPRFTDLPRRVKLTPMGRVAPVPLTDRTA